MSYHFSKIVSLPFDEAIEQVTEALKKNGFGVLSTIDVNTTLKNTIDVDFRPYTILGAGNPQFAYQALLSEDKIGTMLPCNVVVQQTDDGRVEVSAVDPGRLHAGHRKSGTGRHRATGAGAAQSDHRKSLDCPVGAQFDTVDLSREVAASGTETLVADSQLSRLRRLLACVMLLAVLAPAFAGHGSNPTLVDDPSPYLQLHAADPVHWRRWDASSMEEARRSGRLVFISVGYFSCYWCHVMRRESFSDGSIADMLNTAFVPVKVDRELEPALDEYLNAFVQATRGYSGWPLNVFLTPEGHPLLGSVYLPPEQFRTLLQRLTVAWQRGRDELEKAAADAAGALQSGEQEGREMTVDRASVAPILETFVQQSNGIADELEGGFGDTSKFPNVPQLRTLLLVQSLAQEPGLERVPDAHAPPDGRQGPARSPEWRLLPLYDGSQLDDAAFREDALRQRPAGGSLSASGGRSAHAESDAGRL